MKSLIFLHYFISNILGINNLPLTITYNGLEWFNVLGKKDDEWYLSYSRYLVHFDTEDVFEVVGKVRYKVFLKMLHILWKNRNKIDFTIDSY